MTDRDKRIDASLQVPGAAGQPSEAPGTEAVVASAPGDVVAAELVRLGVPEDVAAKVVSDLGAENIDDLRMLAEEDLVAAGMKPLPARKVLAGIAGPAVKPADVAQQVFASPVDILPVVPSDESWLKALQTGGVLSVDSSYVTAAIRAALASKVGLYDVPRKLVAAIEQYAVANEEQVGEEYFALDMQLVRNNYGELFGAIENMDGSFVTEELKQRLLVQIDRILWPAIISFYEQLMVWRESWVQSVGDQSVMAAALISGGSAGSMPPGVLQPPDTAALRDGASAVSDAVNKVFAGLGAKIASALAYDAGNIKKALESDRLPALIGARNREQMLKQLGVGVSATYPRQEQNLIRFVLACIDAGNQPSGDPEYQYYGALYSLGGQIEWNTLGNGRRNRE